MKMKRWHGTAYMAQIEQSLAKRCSDLQLVESANTIVGSKHSSRGVIDDRKRTEQRTIVVSKISYGLRFRNF